MSSFQEVLLLTGKAFIVEGILMWCGGMNELDNLLMNYERETGNTEKALPIIMWSTLDKSISSGIVLE